jgi:hypothetical protein
MIPALALALLLAAPLPLKRIPSHCPRGTAAVQGVCAPKRVKSKCPRGTVPVYEACIPKRHR